MRKQIKRMSKRALAALLCVFLLFSTFAVGTITTATALNTPFTAGSKLYLEPNADWLNDSAKFAAYFYNSENGSDQNEWVEMTKVSSDNVWEVTVPATYTYDMVNFARFDPSAVIAWDNQWNQTKAQGKAAGNVCVITDDKDGDDYAPYWKSNSISISDDTYFYYDNSSTNWSTSNSHKVYMVLITGIDTYSLLGTFSNVNNTFNNANANKGAKLTYKASTEDITGVKGFAFVHSTTTLSTSSSLVVNGTINESVCSANNHTAVYSGDLVTNQYDHCVVIPSADSLTVRHLGGASGDHTSMNITNNINIEGSGTVSVTHYTMSGPSGTSASNDTFTASDSFGAVYLTTVTLQATPDSANDYAFEGWYEGSTMVSDEEQYKYVAPIDGKTITAKFYYDDGTLRYDLTATPVGSGTASVLPARAPEGVTAEFSATPDDGYVFGGWYTDSACTTGFVSYDNPYTFTVGTEDKTLYAKFGTGITQTANAGENGTASVEGGGYSGASIDVLSGTSVKFSAIPNPNYQFDGWYSDSGLNTRVSTEDPYTVTATSANTLYAKYSAVEADAVDNTNDENAPTESAPSGRNNKSRAVNSTELSQQAKDYYQKQVINIDNYKTADSGESGVYATFVHLAGLETNDDTNSFDAIYENSSGNYVTDNNDEKYKYAVQNSLFGALYDIMSSTHSHAVSYPAYGNNSLAHYWLITDSSNVNANDLRGVYTFFYSNADCFSHENMQREHIWPKSKASYLMKTGLGGSDLHHLRPAYGKVNNIKSNWGFADIVDDSTGNVKSGWTNVRTVTLPGEDSPSLWRADKNGETFADYKTNVHGDIARILLYIYTRWKEPNLFSNIVDNEGNPDTSKLPDLDVDDSKDTGERIIDNLDTLLQWMEEDPVSEWEMRRNDLTQDIQGNRNVFIDYPELAWLLFDRAVPADMDTPSLMARNQSNPSNDIDKETAAAITDPVTLDFSSVAGNGAAEITAYDYNLKRIVNDGEQVSRGDVITYTIRPNGSFIRNIIEFSSDSNTNSSAYRTTIPVDNVDTKYTYSRRAGYFNGSANTGYSKERIKVTLRSTVSELSYKISSKTATDNAGGSGSGMVVARYASGPNKNKLIENGDTVPNGSSVTLTFTPDYGSRFYGVSSSNVDVTPTRITGTESYEATVVLKSVDTVIEEGKEKTTESTRIKKFTVYFAQTFNANDKVTDTGSPEYNKNQHINNKGMRPNDDDEWKTETDFTTNFEICGVQIRTDESNTSNKALRFVSVIDQAILDKAESYGYVIGYTNQNVDRKTRNRYAYALVKDGSAGLTVDCTGTDNSSFGDYGLHNSDKRYKYVTAAVCNLQEAGNVAGLDTNIIARPYVVLKPEYRAVGAPSVIYGQYIDASTGEAFCACSGSYNYVSTLAGL